MFEYCHISKCCCTYRSTLWVTGKQKSRRNLRSKIKRKKKPVETKYKRILILKVANCESERFEQDSTLKIQRRRSCVGEEGLWTWAQKSDGSCVTRTHSASSDTQITAKWLPSLRLYGGLALSSRRAKCWWFMILSWYTSKSCQWISAADVLSATDIA